MIVMKNKPASGRFIRRPGPIFSFGLWDDLVGPQGLGRWAESPFSGLDSREQVSDRSGHQRADTWPPMLEVKLRLLILKEERSATWIRTISSGLTGLGELATPITARDNNVEMHSDGLASDCLRVAAKRL